jgi:hypothetical protein
VRNTMGVGRHINMKIEGIQRGDGEGRGTKQELSSASQRGRARGRRPAIGNAGGEGHLNTQYRGGGAAHTISRAIKKRFSARKAASLLESLEAHWTPYTRGGTVTPHAPDFERHQKEVEREESRQPSRVS